MESNTPATDLATDSTPDTVARHGDVDRNGDLVDELAAALRLRAAITGSSAAAEERQLQAVARMLRRPRLQEALRA